MINTCESLKEIGMIKLINIIWYAPEYFDKWRVFPRLFLGVYIYLLYRVVEWFMLLTDPNTQQAGLVSVIVGVGAAWFGLYISATPTQHSAPMPLLDDTSTPTDTTEPK
jgi:hypothetical protein